MTSSARRPTTIGVTLGCPAGIGPEITAAALAAGALPPTVACVAFADTALLALGARRAGVPVRIDDDDAVWLGRGRRRVRVRCLVAGPARPAWRRRPTLCAGAVDEAALDSQREGLLAACHAAAGGVVDALVTAPVRKAALRVGGVQYPGQTELLHAHLAADERPPLMVFAGGPFLLGLATVHVPLVAVSAHITAAVLDNALERLLDAARAVSRRRRPRVAVLGVNPHAGEGGLFGREELDVVAPAVGRLAARGVDVRGPLPADGFFADIARGVRPPDAVLAMAHDQGLAPYKLLAGGVGINVTWGLTVPRTSPDHGTADALVGKRRASSSSMAAALALALRLARRRG